MKSELTPEQIKEHRKITLWGTMWNLHQRQKVIDLNDYEIIVREDLK